jgi:hypothetical protein
MVWFGGLRPKDETPASLVTYAVCITLPNARLGAISRQDFEAQRRA